MLLQGEMKMLKPAQLYADELKRLFHEIMYEEKYKYYYLDGYADEYKPATSTWAYHEFASVDKHGNVIGCIKYTIDRRGNMAHSLSIINFTNDTLTFGVDIAHAIDDIFAKYKFHKLSFSVLVGNPIEKNYDKLCLSHGGRIVGVHKEHSVLLDGEYYDQKLYEILRRDYMMTRRDRKWN